METAKFCTQCGEALPPGAKHCPQCGAEVATLQVPGPGEAERPISPSPIPPVPQQMPSGGPYAGPVSAPAAPASGIGMAPPQGPYGGPPPVAGVYRAAPAQGAISPQRALSRKRLGGGMLTLIAGIIMLPAHDLVFKGGLTSSNLWVDLFVIACGLFMLFARGGRVVALAFLASLTVSVLDLTLLWEVFAAVAAVGLSGLTTLLSSGAWVPLVAMLMVLVGFLVALVSLFRHS